MQSESREKDVAHKQTIKKKKKQIPVGHFLSHWTGMGMGRPSLRRGPGFYVLPVHFTLGHFPLLFSMYNAFSSPMSWLRGGLN